jgi:ATP-dependent Lon protease
MPNSERFLNKLGFAQALRPPQDWEVMPMMPLRGMLIFPHMITHLDVGRDRSINAINEAMENDKNLLFLAMQKDPQIDEPSLDDIYEVGSVVLIRQLLKLPGGTVRLLVEGLYRARLMSCLQDDPFLLAEIEPMSSYRGEDPIEEEATKRILLAKFDDYAKNSKRVASETMASITNISDPDVFSDLVGGQLTLQQEERQNLLEILNVTERMNTIIGLIDKENEILEMEKNIANRVRQQMDKSQREYYLREQIKAIQVELGEGDERSAEVEKYRKKAEEAHLPDYVMERFEAELKRLEKTPPMMAEAMVITNYLDVILDLPWIKSTEENLDILAAEKILDEDHYGLTQAKERIVEYLASCQLKNNLKGPIICLVGPPGVGKTSLARSIARATGRRFVRMSLGGVHDEAEIRGHRRTYIGSMPGRILSGIKTAGVNNPLFLLDEVDKLGKDWRGDPTSALLEALDPEQNNTFSDHYLEIPFDLSKVMFITTANLRSDIPRPLLDRMEVIDISSYTEEEKLNIAIRHLVKKQLAEHGLTADQVKFTNAALRAIIRSHTREAGVRELERRIAKICRKVGRDIVAGSQPPFKIGMDNIAAYLGKPRYIENRLKHQPQLGIAIGLAWTEIGGEILEIEVQTLPGKGKFTITGKLGDVMKESVQAGYTWLRTIGRRYNIPDNLEETTDLHIHVPEGAIPKDGPSAGITIATAICSQLSGIKVRGDLAMTGEITLHGKVLPVGGIKEKLLAAYRFGIKEIILPAENTKDLEDIPPSIREKMTFHPVRHMDEVLEIALVKEKAPAAAE